jgi:hypothetical protein
MLIRIIDFVHAVDERTKDGHVSPLDAATGAFGAMTSNDLLWLRDAAVDLQHVCERTVLERDRNFIDEETRRK